MTADTGTTIRNPQAAALVQDRLERDYEERLSVDMHGRVITAWVRHQPSAARESETTGTIPQR